MGKMARQIELLLSLQLELRLSVLVRSFPEKAIKRSFKQAKDSTRNSLFSSEARTTTRESFIVQTLLDHLKSGV